MSVGKETIIKALKESKTPYTAFIARDLGIPERDIFRALPKEDCTELDIKRLREIMNELGKCALVLLIVKSGGAVLEVESNLSEQSESRGYYNITGNNAHMHIMLDCMDTVFAVHREPSPQKPMAYSIQFFDTEGKAALKIFLTQDKETKTYRENDMEVFNRIKELFIKG